MRLVFEFWVLRFQDLGAPFSIFWCFVFEIWVLRFRVFGASFSRFGCFVLRSSFSSASYLKLPSRASLFLSVSIQLKSIVLISECTFKIWPMLAGKKELFGGFKLVRKGVII